MKSINFRSHGKYYPLFATVLLLAALLAPGPTAAAADLTIHCIDVGQGDATLVIGPTGTTMLIDAGNTGQGAKTVIPYLNSLGIGRIDNMVASHYHADHIGALDEVANGGFFPVAAYDRGTQGGTPGTQAYSQYASAIASVRRTILPGQVLPLGGGATATCIVVNGELTGGGSVNVSGSHLENASSVGLLIELGDFQYFTAGDLPGGGLSTPDVEGPVGLILGDVEVLRVSHHGSSTSSRPAFVQAITPDLGLISVGENNSYGHPTTETLETLNSAAASIPIYQTSIGAGSAGGVIVDDTFSIVTDGTRYRVERDGKVLLHLLVDEANGTAPAPGTLVVTEYMHDPLAVSDSTGEYLELFNTSTEDISLRGVAVGDGATDSFLVASGMVVPAGEQFVLGRNGEPAANGGYRAGTVWPDGAFQLVNTSDAIVVTRNTLPIDDVRYDNGATYPDPTGKSVERIDCLGATAGSNFAESTAPFGGGDCGTPGSRNCVDATDFRPAVVERGNLVPGGDLTLTCHAYAAPGATGFAGLAAGTSPGFTVKGVHIPLNYDSLFRFARVQPQLFGTLDAHGKGTLVLPVPANPGLSGFRFHTALIVIAPSAGVVDASDGALSLQIQ